MSMGNEKESAWIIYVDNKVHGVYITTGTDGAFAKQQAEGKVEMLRKEHKGPIRHEGPFQAWRK